MNKVVTMKKSKQLLVLIMSFITLTSAMAYGSGGSFGGNPGDISQTRELLEQKWNGKPGVQNTAVLGLIVQWHADVCGTMNGKVTDKTKCQVKK